MAALDCMEALALERLAETNRYGRARTTWPGGRSFWTTWPPCIRACGHSRPSAASADLGHHDDALLFAMAMNRATYWWDAIHQADRVIAQ
jgi:hypothetical protein